MEDYDQNYKFLRNMASNMVIRSLNAPFLAKGNSTARTKIWSSGAQIFDSQFAAWVGSIDTRTGYYGIKFSQDTC